MKLSCEINFVFFDFSNTIFWDSNDKCETALYKFSYNYNFLVHFLYMENGNCNKEV